MQRADDALDEVIKIIGVLIGMVMCSTRWGKFAPSSVAASYSCVGTFLNAASQMTMLAPHVQVVVQMKVAIEEDASLKNVPCGRPRLERIWFMIPPFTENRSCHSNADATPGMTHGR